MRPAGFGRQETAGHVHIEMPPKIGKVDIGECVRVVDARVVDEHVQPPELLKGRLDQPRDPSAVEMSEKSAMADPPAARIASAARRAGTGISAASVDPDTCVIDDHPRAV